MKNITTRLAAAAFSIATLALGSGFAANTPYLAKNHNTAVAVQQFVVPAQALYSGFSAQTPTLGQPIMLTKPDLCGVTLMFKKFICITKKGNISLPPNLSHLHLSTLITLKDKKYSAG